MQRSEVDMARKWEEGVTGTSERIQTCDGYPTLSTNTTLPKTTSSKTNITTRIDVDFSRKELHRHLDKSAQVRVKWLKPVCNRGSHRPVPRSSEASKNQRQFYFFSSGFPNENAPGFGAPKPNAAGVVPFCPCAIPEKLNGEAAPPPVDVEGVTGVNINGDAFEPVVSFVVVVLGVFGKLKENVGLSVAGTGVGRVVEVEVVMGNALVGVVVAPNTLPFLNGLGPGLEVSSLEGVNEKTPGEVPVVAGVVDGKATLGSDAPGGLFVVKLNEGWVGCDAGFGGAG